jgi:hypothetical protein
MTQNNNILQELKELESSLADLAHQDIYSVPNGYFEGLAGIVLNRIKALEAANAAEEIGYLSPMLSNISKQVPYTVPAGYFEKLDENLLKNNFQENRDEQTASEELETLSPLLSGLKKQMPYSVPQDYFEKLTTGINAPVTKTETKIVSIGSRKWFRYAAAAVITGVIVMAGFVITNKDKVDPGTNSHAWVEKKLKKVSTEKIEEFIQLTDEDKLVASTETKIQDVKELVKDVPENEIQSLLNDAQFLDEPDTDDVADETIMN